MVDIDKIKVSSRLDDIIENSVDEGYSYVCKQRIKRKNVMLRVAAVILGFSLLGGVFQNQVSAEVRLAIMKIEDYLGLDRSLDDYKSIVEKTISKNGITMQLNEVILDNDEVIVSYTVMSQEDLDEDKDIVTVKKIAALAEVDSTKISDVEIGSAKVTKLVYTDKKKMCTYSNGEYTVTGVE